MNLFNKLIFLFKKWAFLWHERSVLDDIWDRYLPTSCQICAIHRYGVEHGYKSQDSEPEFHHCMEKAISHEVERRLISVATPQRFFDVQVQTATSEEAVEEEVQRQLISVPTPKRFFDVQVQTAASEDNKSCD